MEFQFRCFERVSFALSYVNLGEGMFQAEGTAHVARGRNAVRSSSRSIVSGLHGLLRTTVTKQGPDGKKESRQGRAL
jgi:hypothetical protein